MQPDLTLVKSFSVSPAEDELTEIKRATHKRQGGMMRDRWDQSGQGRKSNEQENTQRQKAKLVKHYQNKTGNKVQAYLLNMGVSVRC